MPGATVAVRARPETGGVFSWKASLTVDFPVSGSITRSAGFAAFFGIFASALSSFRFALSAFAAARLTAGASSSSLANRSLGVRVLISNHFHSIRA